jgi:transposase
MNKEWNMAKAKILQAKGLKQKEISEVLGVTERTVRNYLNPDKTGGRTKPRKSKLDPYKEFIKAILEDHPYYNCELIFEQIQKAGYTGRISILRDHVHAARKKILTDAVIRFETVPGLQAQVDWKELGRQSVDGRDVKLYAFVMVLGYSRSPFLYFTTSMRSDMLLRCHLMAFKHFGGVPAEILYDNMKTAFIADTSGYFYPQKDLLHFASHYGFEPKRCRVRRPQTKGKVERMIDYFITNFWPRVEGRDLSLDELNRKALEWIESISHKRIGGLNETRRERFTIEEPTLKALPAIDLDIRRSIICAVNRESCITFETNKYSIKPDFIGQNVCLRVDDGSRKAEIFLGIQSLRVIQLDEPGRRSVRIFEDDIAAIRDHHRADMKKRLQIMGRTRKKKSIIEVEVRHPSAYDFIHSAGGEQ